MWDVDLSFLCSINTLSVSFVAAVDIMYYYYDSAIIPLMPIF